MVNFSVSSEVGGEVCYYRLSGVNQRERCVVIVEWSEPV